LVLLGRLQAPRSRRRPSRRQADQPGQKVLSEIQSSRNEFWLAPGKRAIVVRGFSF
jgi:hypothetical protein